MTFDFSRVKKTTFNANDTLTNPVEFFYKLNHPEIDELRPNQKETLEVWYGRFLQGENDQIIQLDTGAGKTLIGLYAAESIRRSKVGKVLYVCVNNFLAQQTIDRASEYGIKTSHYLNGSWTGQNEFLENKQICVTNYDSIFNPYSKFSREVIKGIIFDDSHFAIDLLDKQFTLNISDMALVDTFFDLFKNVENINDLKESRDPTKLYIVPPMDWWSNIPMVKRILNSKISESLDTSNKFAWKNLFNIMDSTFCFIKADRVQISTLYPDVNNHFIFKRNVNRIYLSATTSNIDDMIRAFGVEPNIISIKNPTYRPDRLFLFSNKLTKINDVEAIIRNNPNSLASKVLVLVTSREKFEEYKNEDNKKNIQFIESTDEIKNKIENFKTSSKQVLVIANRYEGIDMAGDSCHFLIVDNISNYGSLKEKYLSDCMVIEGGIGLKSNMASKITQAFGRTTRGASDYSVIFIMGDTLNRTLINEDNLKFFKKELVEDLKTGMSCSDSIDDENDLRGIINEMLSQSDSYKSFIESTRTTIGEVSEVSDHEKEIRINLAKKERKIINLFINKQYDKCLIEINRVEDFQTILELYFSEKTLALYFCIASFCALKIDNIELARSFYNRAIGINSMLGDVSFKMNKELEEDEQTNNIRNESRSFPDFNWQNSNKNIEEDFKKLGEFLGFKSERPEKDVDGSTLDCLWRDEYKRIVIGFELKTKKKNETLNVKEIGQSLGHNEWLKEHFPSYERYMYIVGNLVFRTVDTNPGEELLYINLNDISELSNKISSIYENKKFFPNDIKNKILQYNLNIEKIFQVKKIKDLQVSV